MKSKNKIKIGLLVPYSGVHTEINTELEQGFQLGLEHADADLAVYWFAEYIQNGSSKDTEKALHKLILFNHVDLIIGVIGTKVILQFLSFIEQHQIPVVMLNLGGYVPPPELKSEYLFYNSLHLWQSQYGLGSWAQQRWGGTVSVGMSVYEAGYDIHNTFRLGAYRGGADNVYLAVLPYTKDSYDTLPLIDVWRQQKPVHAHALLSGKEGDQFLENLAKSELSATLPVSVNPFMVEDGKPVSSPHLNGLQLINATTWCAGLQNEDNKKFVLAYTENYEKIPGVYSLLAYETGLALGTALTKTDNSLNKNKLTAALHQHLAIGPRGDIFLATSPLLKTKLPVYIRIGSVNSDQVWENSITGIMDGIEWNEPVLEETRLNVSGWQNPYLCV